MNSAIGDFSANSVFFDAGALYAFRFLDFYKTGEPNFRLGVNFKNIGAGMKYADTSEPLPFVQRYGLGYKAGDTLTISSDLVKQSGFPLWYGIGVENITGKFINLRLGYFGGENKQSFSGGIGIITKLSRFQMTADFAYSFELNRNNSWYMTLTFMEAPPKADKYSFQPEVVFRDRIVEKETVKTQRIVDRESTIVTQRIENRESIVESVTQVQIIENRLSITDYRESVVESITQERIVERASVVTQVQVLEGVPQVTVVTQFRTEDQLRKVIVMVLDFENTGSSQDWAFLSRTIGDSVSSSLAKERDVSVISRLKLEQSLRSMGYPGYAGLSIGDLQAIGAGLGATAVIRGSFIEIDKALMITTELFDIASGTVCATGKVRGEVGLNMFDLMDMTVEAIVKDVRQYKESR